MPQIPIKDNVSTSSHCAQKVVSINRVVNCSLKCYENHCHN